MTRNAVHLMSATEIIAAFKDHPHFPYPDWCLLPHTTPEYPYGVPHIAGITWHMPLTTHGERYVLPYFADPDCSRYLTPSEVAHLYNDLPVPLHYVKAEALPLYILRTQARHCTPRKEPA